MDNNLLALGPQKSQILRRLRRDGPLSRRELHLQTGLRPNTVGDQVAELLEMGLLCEQTAESQGPGRPRVPLAIDPDRRHVVGIAIRPGRIAASRLNLLGERLGSPYTANVDSPRNLIKRASLAIAEVANDQTFLIGMSTTGFIDSDTRRMLLSSALQGEESASLDPLFDAAGNRPLIVNNDMHALAVRWMQQHHHTLEDDVLMIYFDDGELGAAVLVRGEPNRGCLMGGNELGHTRLPVNTEPCYCGHTGCLERICSTQFLRLQGAYNGSLLEHVVHFHESDQDMVVMIDLLATGFANTINFLRPHRVVLVSQYTRYPAFIDAVVRAMRSRVLIELVDRVDYHSWDQPATGVGETAGWLGLAAIYHPEWTRTTLSRPDASASTGDASPIDRR